MALPDNPTLPDRLFYSFPKAVHKINSLLPEKCHIDESDLLHFFTIGKLEVCFRLNVNGIGFDDDDDDEEAKHTLEFSCKDNDDIRKVADFLKTFNDSNGKAWIKTNYGKLSLDYSVDYDDSNNIHYFFDSLKPHKIDSGDFFCALPRFPVLMPIDTIIENGFRIMVAKTPRTTNLTIFESNDVLTIDIPAIISFSKIIDVPYSTLVITHKELELFLNGGKDIPYDDKKSENSNLKKTSNKRINAQAKFIRALITVNYGSGVANNVRWNINAENSNKNEVGKIRQHFQIKGLGHCLPVGETVEKWIKDIELDFE